MAEVSGKMYLVIGLAVGVLSLTLNILRKDSSMTLFAVVGVCLFLWGLFKVLKQKRHTHKLHENQLMGKKHPYRKHETPAHLRKEHPNPHPDKYCHKCGNNMKSFANFCANCGFKMR